MPVWESLLDGIWLSVVHPRVSSECFCQSCHRALCGGPERVPLASAAQIIAYSHCWLGMRALRDTAPQGWECPDQHVGQEHAFPC